jgi:FkbM family methyltransferase
MVVGFGMTHTKDRDASGKHHRTITLIRHMLKWYGLRIPYFRGKGRPVDLLASYCKQLTYGEEIAERQDLLWELDLSCIIQRSLYYLGVWEVWETRFLQGVLSPGLCFMDVGANFGYYALLAAKIVGPSGSGYAFEPSGIIFQKLVGNIGRNGLTWLRPERLALGDSVGFTSLQIPELANQGAQAICPDRSPRSERVQMTTMDRYVETIGLSRIDFIKVDIEGYEPFFLQGAAGAIREFAPLMMLEVSPLCLKRYGCTQEDLIGQLELQSYDTFTLEQEKLRRWQPLRNPCDYQNVFAIPRKGKWRFGLS